MPDPTDQRTGEQEAKRVLAEALPESIGIRWMLAHDQAAALRDAGLLLTPERVWNAMAVEDIKRGQFVQAVKDDTGHVTVHLGPN